MFKLEIKWAVAVVAATTATFSAPMAQAQAWPTKPVTIVVPFPPGGGTDAFARPLFAVMTKNVGRQFVIDNKGGAGGTLGADLAAKAAPDGYTFFMGAVHHTIAPSMYPKLDYNIETDFVPVGLISSVPQVIVVNPQKVAATTLPQLLDFMRKNPGKLNYGSAGNGTSHHLAGELFKLQTSTFITHIPYRGAGPALQDLIAGQVDLMFDGLGSSAGHIKGGRIRAIAVASGKRRAGLPRPATGQDRRRAEVRGRHLVRAVGAQGHAARGRDRDAERDEEGPQQRRAQDHVDGPGHRDAEPVGRRFRQVRRRAKSSAGPKWSRPRARSWTEMTARRSLRSRPPRGAQAAGHGPALAS